MLLTLTAFLLAGPADAPKVLRKPAAVFSPAKIDPLNPILPVAALSPDGKLVARSQSGLVSVFKVGAARPLFDTDARLAAGRAVFSNDGTLMAFPGAEHHVHIFSVETGKPQASFRIP